MNNRLTACVLVPHLRAQIAMRQHAAPLVVATAHNDRATVLDTCPQAASAGVRAGMPVLHARRCCRSLTVTTVDAPALLACNRALEAVLHTFADDVQRAGAAWLLTLPALGAGFRHAESIGHQLHAAVLTTGLTCSVGLGPTVIVARVAAHVAGAASVRVVIPAAEQSFLAPLPLHVLPGTGAQTLRALARLGVETIGQLQALPASALTAVCGARGRQLVHLAQGRDIEAAPGAAATISVRWQTPGEPEADARRLRAHLHALTAETGRDLRARKLAAGQLTVRVVWADGSSGQRTEREGARRDLDRGLHTWSRRALGTLLRERRLAVRAIAVTLGDLGPRQDDLFATADARPWRLQQALDQLAQRYGPQTVLPAALVGLLPPRS